MLKKYMFIAAISLAIAGQTLAQTGVVESAIESSTDVVFLPETAPSTIAVRSTFGENPKILAVTPETTYFAGSERITLAQLRLLASKKKTGLYVFYVPAKKMVTRIKIDADLLPAVAGGKSQR